MSSVGLVGVIGGGIGLISGLEVLIGVISGSFGLVSVGLVGGIDWWCNV